MQRHEPKLIQDVVNGVRVFLLSPYSSANMIFISEVAVKLVKYRGKPIILIDNTGLYRVEVLDNIAKRYGVVNALDMVKIFNKCILPLDNVKEIPSILVFNIDEQCISSLKRSSSRILFATCSKVGNLRKMLRFRIAYLKHAYGREYLLTYLNETIRICIEPTGIRLSLQTPRGILGKALNALRDSIMEYGTITTKDAIYVLMGSLKIDKRYARKILQELVNKKYIKIEGGYILLNI